VSDSIRIFVLYFSFFLGCITLFQLSWLCFLYVNLEISTVGLVKINGNSELKSGVLKCSVL